MVGMFFGQYLLSKGVIDRDALIDAIEHQRLSNLSLPELAVREGFFDERLAKKILTRYRTSEAGIDELCREIGKLDQQQIDRLKEIQDSDWVRIGAALVDGGHLTQSEMEAHLKGFLEHDRSADHQLEMDYRSCPDPETVKTCIELSAFHLGRIVDRPVKLQSLDFHDGSLRSGWQRYGQKLAGDRDLFVVIDVGDKLAAEIATRFLGIEVEQGSETATDAVCEFVNVIGGNACTRLEMFGYTLRPDPPFSFDGVEPSVMSGESVRATVLVGDAAVDVQVFLT